MPILLGTALESALESADSSSQSADFNADAPVGMYVEESKRTQEGLRK